MSTWIRGCCFLLLSCFVGALDITSNRNGDDARSLSSKDELIVKVLPGQYLGSLVQASSQSTTDWLFPQQSKASMIVEEGFVPPIFDIDAVNDFPTLQLNNQTGVVSPVHLIIRPFPSAYHPLLFILGSTRCSFSPSPTASQKLQSRVVLLLNVKDEICYRNFAQNRMNLVRSLTSFFSDHLQDYWWMADQPTFQDVRLNKMVMTMLEGNGSSQSSSDVFSSCTIVLPIGCGARVPGNFIDNVVKLQDDFASFPSEIRTSVLRWSVKIFDPLMLPVVTQGDEARKAADSRLLLRNPRHRHRRSAFGLSRGTNLLESYQISDYMNDESWALENRLAMDASSGDGFQPPQPRPSQQDVFDVLTMVPTTTTTAMPSSTPSMLTLDSSSTVVPIVSDHPSTQFTTSYSSIAANDVDGGVENADVEGVVNDNTDERARLQVDTPESALNFVMPTQQVYQLTIGPDDQPIKPIIEQNFPHIITSTKPPNPYPEFTEDSLFIAQHKILHYPIRRRFEGLASFDKITFLLSKCSSPKNDETVVEACSTQTTSTDDWLYYNYKNMALEGIVPSGVDSMQIFNLTGISETRAKSFIIRISIAPSAKNPQIADRTHEFCLNLNRKVPEKPEKKDANDVGVSLLRMREQIQIARLVTGVPSSTKMSVDDIVVLSVGYSNDPQPTRRHLSSMCFSQVHLTPVDGGKRCPRTHFGRQLGHLVKLPATSTERATHSAKFLPSPGLSAHIRDNSNYEVTSLAFTLLNACKNARMDLNSMLNTTTEPHLDLSGSSTVNSIVAGDVWLTLVIPGAVLLCMLLLALIVACVLYRCIRNKTHSHTKNKKASRVSVALGNGNSVFLTKGAPAIFQEELDAEVPGPPTRLLIAADDRSREQFSGCEGSDREGEDTVSSSAPGGSPGRLHSSEPNVTRRGLVPATPPPPDYRLHHHHRTNAPLLLPPRAEDASPDSRELEEMSELSRPLLVQQSLVQTSIQTVGTVA